MEEEVAALRVQEEVGVRESRQVQRVARVESVPVQVAPMQQAPMPVGLVQVVPMQVVRKQSVATREGRVRCPTGRS